MTITSMQRVCLSGVPKDPADSEVDEAVRSAAEGVTDFSWLLRGDAVFIKPALNSGNPYPATTSPAAIGSMVRLLKEKGAGRVILGDMSGIESVKLTPSGVKGSTRKLMQASGMANAALEAGAELHFFEEAGWGEFYEDYPASGSSWKKGLMMPNILRAVEHIVLMPRCARHALMGSTLGLKAAVGYWRTDTRLEYHKDAKTIHNKTAEANTVRTLLEKQRFVLSAADQVVSTFGPNIGRMVKPDFGLVLASKSVVAHDMISLAWLLINRENIVEAKSKFRDPYNAQLLVSLANRWVVYLLGGLRQVLGAQKLAQKDIKTIWEDRVLHHAFEVFGGKPDLTLVWTDDIFPSHLKKRLERMTTSHELKKARLKSAS